MDPELMQLFLAAKGKNKNVSGLLGNLDNQMLAYLSGAYNPLTQSQDTGGGSLFAQYENYNQPAIQDVLAQIRNGVDKYWLSSYIDSNIDPAAIAASGFQVQDFKNLASALQQDYQKGAVKQDMWAKAGLSNPLDLYTAENAPMGAKTQERVRQIDKELGRVSPMVEQAKSALSGAYQKLQGAKTSEGKGAVERYFSGKDLSNIIKRQGTDWNPIFGRIGGNVKSLTKWLEGQDNVSIDEALSKMKELDTGKPTGYSTSSALVEDALKKDVKGRVKRLSPKNTAVVEGTPEFYAFREALNASQRQMNKEYGLQQKKAANQRGALRAAQEQGRTPLRDELATIMRFVAGK